MSLLSLAAATAAVKAPLKTKLEAMARAGVEGVRFDVRDEFRPEEWSATARRDLRHLLKEHRLTAAEAEFPMRRDLIDPHNLDQRIAAIQAGMSLAGQLNCRSLSLRIGRIEPADEPSGRLQRELLDDLAAHGNHVGVALALQANSDDPEAWLALAASVQRGPAGVEFDPLCWNDAEAAFRTLHGLVRQVGLRDGLTDRSGVREVELGTGRVDWPALIGLLLEANYSGWTTLVASDRPIELSDFDRRVARARVLLGKTIS